jgi:hypothetical protein
MIRAASVPALLAVLAAGCAGERVEYRYRNPLSDRAKDEVDHTLPDGTRVVYRDRPAVSAGRFGDSAVPAPTGQDDASAVGASDGSGPALELRIEHADGSIELRAFTPAQVIAHLQHAIRNREYPPFYAQMLTKEARKEWDQRGGEQAFAAWMDERRGPVMEFLNRTSYGMFSSDVITRATGPRTIELQLTPHLHGEFAFEAVEFERQGGMMRLRALR